MKILADECCPGNVVAALREKGHDVVYIAEEASSLSDARILQWGLEEQRIILTEDRDFSELGFLNQLPTFGIVLMRFHHSQRQAKVNRVCELFAEHADKLPHTMTTLTLTNIRVRSL
jgi:predicted nuclease of predicted toxin-antitoxin system